MAGAHNIGSDLYTRYRSLIGRIDPSAGRSVPQTHKPRAIDANAPPSFSEPWRNASVSMSDEVTRKLLETQSSDMDETSEEDPSVDETGDDTDPTEPTEPTEPTMPTDPGPVDTAPPPTTPVVDPAPTTPPVETMPPVDPAPPVDPMPPVDPNPPVVVQPPVDPVDVTPPTPSAPAPVIPAAAAALNTLFHAQAVANDPVLQYKRALFRTLDSDSDGLVSSTEIAAAINSVGGNQGSAAALNGVLDPQGTGAVTQQQFLDRLPAATYDYFDLMNSEPYYNPNSAGGAVAMLQGLDVSKTLERPGSTGGAARTDSVLTPFDFNRNGSVDLNELMVAVQGGGGTRQSARALFSQFDPNGTGSITNDQFNRNLPIPTYDMTTGQVGYATDVTVAQGVSALFFSMVQSQQPEERATRSLFYGMDADGDGKISSDDLASAVKDAGGSEDQANALRAQLDPDNTGTIGMEQFLGNLPDVKVSATGVASVVVGDPPAPPPQVMVYETTSSLPPIAQNISDNMLSVLVAQQQNEEAWRGMI